MKSFKDKLFTLRGKQEKIFARLSLLNHSLKNSLLEMFKCVVSGRCCVPLIDNRKPTFFPCDLVGALGRQAKQSVFNFSLGSKRRYFRRVIAFFH